MFPKIELHVHREGTIRAWTLLQIARRNDVSLPAATEAELLQLADRGTVLDVCPISNARTRVVPSLAEHPLPALVAAGLLCSVSTDEPAMFGTDLSADYAAAAELGVGPQRCYEAGARGALCDERARSSLQRIGVEFDLTATRLATEPR